jgi:hypothetical protein
VNKQQKIETIKRKTRQRLLFAVITVVMCLSYVLNYTEGGSFLAEPLGDSHVTGSLAMFAGLIVIYILLELLFLALNRDGDEG